MSAFASLKAVAAYCSQARALFARLATPPAPARAAAYDAVIRALLTAGVWGKLDALYLFAAADEATALTNVRQALYGATAVNSPAFTVDRGYAGNGTTQYLNTGFTPSTAGGQYAQNSATLFWYIRTRNMGSTGDAIGAYTGNGGNASAFMDLANPGAGLRINGTSSSDVYAGSTPAQAGLWSCSRTSASEVAGYYNGAEEVGANDRGSFGLPTVPIIVLGQRAPQNLSTDEVAAAGFGASLTATEHAALYNAIHGYLQALGAVT